MRDNDLNPDWGWYFEKAGLSTAQGVTASAEEHFKDITLEESLVREMAQNSMDVKASNLKGPVRMTFELRWVPKETIRDFEKLKEHIEASDLSTRSVEDNTRLKDAAEAAQKDSFAVLRIGDYGTTGLTGREDDNEGNPPIVALTRARGISSGKSGKGGSFGLGATTGALASELSTVLWTTRTAVSEETIFAGQSQLATHQIGEERYGPDGFFLDKNRTENFHYLRNQESFDGFPLRSQPGTDTYILGYVNAGEDPRLDKIRDSLVKHFFVAIDSSRLEVDCIVDGKAVWHLDSTNIANYALENENVAPFYRALKEPPIEGELPGIGKVRLHVIFDDTLPKKMNTITMRQPLMCVTTYKHLIRDKYAAIFICEGEPGNSLLRSIEPPAHNNWVPERGKQGNRVVRRIKEFIRDKLRERVNTTRGEEIVIDSLKELLPSGLGNDQFKISGEGTTTHPEHAGKEESSTVHGGDSSLPDARARTRTKAKIAVDIPVQPSKDGHSGASSPGPTSGSRSGKGGKHRSSGSQRGDAGDGKSDLLNPLLSMRSWQNADSNLLTAILKSPEPVHGNIQLVAKNGSGEIEKNFVLPVESVTQVVGNEERALKFSNNFILGIDIPENDLKATLRIRFRTNHRFLLELK